MKLLVAAVLLALLILRAHASTVAFQTAPLTGNQFYDSNNTLLPNGDLIRVGTFTNPTGFNLSMSIAQIEATGGWTEFGSTVTGTQAGNAGKLAGNVNNATASAFDGLPVYVWAFNSSTASNATATGIFRASRTSGPPNPWLFPVNNAAPPGNLVTLSSDDATIQAISNIGSVDSGNKKLQLSALTLAGVPELSSTGLFYSVASLLFFGSQRLRRRS
jgi:hypothetical protein